VCHDVAYLKKNGRENDEGGENIKNTTTLHEVFVKKQQYIVAHDPMLYVHFFSLLFSVKKTWFSNYEISEIWWTP